MILPVGAAGDWLEALLPILFVLFWIVSQVINVVQRLRGAGGGDAARRGKGGVPGERVVRPAAPPRDAGADARKELERQIEAFRRGQAEAARTAGRQSPPGSPTPAAARPAAPRPSAAAQPPAAKEPGKKQVPARPRPTAQSSPALGGHEGDIARHVEGAFAHDLSHARAARPAAAAPVAGAMVASALEANAGDSAAGAALPRSTAAELVAMIRNPATVRQAIILAEVLGRPVDRW